MRLLKTSSQSGHASGQIAVVLFATPPGTTVAKAVLNALSAPILRILSLQSMRALYTNGEYLDATRTWHAEDSPWKADQIQHILVRNRVRPRTIAEIGCGAGAILGELAAGEYLRDARFFGYDISPQAIQLCERRRHDRIEFRCEDLTNPEVEAFFDLLLVIDVVEHVPDYLGFLERCRARATLKVYHLPLDLHVSSLLRHACLTARESVGHLHYFTAESALATLRDTGHEVIDHFYTDGALGLYRQHASPKRAVANVPRWLLSLLSVPLAARLLGGYSLLVLAK